MPGLANQPVVIHWALGRTGQQGYWAAGQRKRTRKKEKKAVHSLTPISTDCHSLSASGGVIFLKFLLALNMQLLLYLLRYLGRYKYRGQIPSVSLSQVLFLFLGWPTPGQSTVGWERGACEMLAIWLDFPG